MSPEPPSDPAAADASPLARLHRFRRAGDTAHLEDLLDDPAALQAALNAEFLLPRFQLTTILGRGGAGCSVAAHDRELDRRLAFKFIIERDAAARDEHEREVAALARLTHPGILPLIDAGAVEPGLRWLAMPLVAGGDLAAALAAGDLRDRSWRTVCQTLRPIADALVCAHDQGVIHGDVSPANIILPPDADAVLIDWGSAVIDGQAPSRPRRAPGYAAPETLAGQPVGAAADIYAFGRTLAHALDGQPLPGDRAPLPGTTGPLPRRVRAVLARATATAATERYPTMAALADDLRALLNDEALRALPEGLPRRLWRQARRRPALVVLVAILLATVALVVGLVAEQQRLLERQWQPALQATLDQPLDPTAWLTRAYPHWQQANGIELPVQGPDSPWQVVDGQLRSRWTAAWPGAVTLWHRHLRGNALRVRYRCTPLVSGRNCNLFFGSDRFSDWGIHIGGFDRLASVVLTDSRLGLGMQAVASARLPAPLAVGRSHLIEAELRPGTVQLWIDGRAVLHYDDPFIGLGERQLGVGIEVAGNDLQIDDVQVERLAPALRQPAHVTAAALIEVGAVAEALARYHAIPLARLDAAERAAVGDGIGRCLAQLGRPNAARQAWQAVFTDTAAPTAWRGTAGVRLALLAVASGSEDDVAELAAALRQLATPATRLHLYNVLCTEHWQGRPRWALGQEACRAHYASQAAWFARWATLLDLDLGRLDSFQRPKALAAFKNQLAQFGYADLVPDFPSLLVTTRDDDAVQPFRPPADATIGALPDPKRFVPYQPPPQIAPDLLADPLLLTPERFPDPVTAWVQWELLAQQSFTSDAGSDRLRSLIHRLGQLPVHDRSSAPLLRALGAIALCGMGDRAAARAFITSGLDAMAERRWPHDSALLRALLAGEPVTRPGEQLSAALLACLAADLAGEPLPPRPAATSRRGWAEALLDWRYRQR